MNTCIIGVGNAGINITEVLNKVNLDYLFLENHSSTGLDLDNKIEITIPSRINPSLDQIRKILLEATEDILSKINQYQSIIIVGNLASKFGSAVPASFITNAKEQHKKRDNLLNYTSFWI